MAIDYELILAADVEPDRLLGFVEDALGLAHERDADFHSAVGTATVGRRAEGFNLVARRPTDMNTQHLEEWAGIKGRAKVRFIIDKACDTRQAFLRLLAATLGVLEQVPGDAALILNGEHVWLLRRGGHLALKDDPRVFDGAALALVRVPYELCPLPSA
ncbi:MAG: hypothetical protein H6708_29610 [Kofleriaceae bacterium]|nr:hypothetical protein [Kofleriaceae bacterium]